MDEISDLNTVMSDLTSVMATIMLELEIFRDSISVWTLGIMSDSNIETLEGGHGPFQFPKVLAVKGHSRSKRLPV